MASKAVREPIATWWRIEGWSIAITPVKVVAFTGSFVTIIEKEWSFGESDKWRERREKRDDIFPTFEEAKAAYVGNATAAVEAAKNNLQQKRTRLAAIESLQPNIGKPLEK